VSRDRLLAALVAERFPAEAIEAERVDFAEPETVRLARVVQARIEASAGESAEQRADRRAELLAWPDVPREVVAATPDRPPTPRSLVGQRRAGMDELTLAAVRAADRRRKAAARRAS